MQIDQWINLFEAMLWFAIGMILAYQSRFVAHRFKRLCLVTGITFFMFGLTDIWEIFTRAWFKPPALFVLNAFCVIVLLLCSITYYRRNKQPLN
jgi:glucose uptake protein GlcU